MFGKGMFLICEVLASCSQSVKATTLLASDPSEKPYYVPANTQYVTNA